ncbi:MAG: 1-acyl-sn-glycerol-3-phosphate acyltransferase [Clostridium sp.]|uniref:lysophospholipid acyltransferase family protein n=1 Tax=Clostridium sp. TaxID=1506 RepID=UPI0025BB987B|nr:lysophospholipid acyltransferase family protein [Clostridium sp.]MCE5220309.1 1-acyl-sn-glycerol-3-phosphate acyltransferase [Clostridium sp.]
MLFRKIIYVFYIILVLIKGLKYELIKKFKGEASALEYSQKTTHLWCKFIIKTVGIDLEIKGLENIPKEPCVFIGNHSSILDIPILLCTVNRNIGFISKKEILKTPIIGYWLKRTNSVTLDRENPRTAVEAINEAVQNLKEGSSMAIFPEGTRNKEGKVGEFKKGSLKLATKAKAKIVPVSIDRASRAFEDNREFKPTKIKLVFGETIDTKNLSKEEEINLAENIRNTIISNLGI